MGSQPPALFERSGFINFVPVDPVARPSQYFYEFVVAHSAKSSRTAPSTENPSFIGSLQILAQSHFSAGDIAGEGHIGRRNLASD
jgi:hypothetical protein